MNKGVLYAIGAYSLWGFFPIYLKTLSAVPAFQITAHRVVWSFALLTIILLARREVGKLLAALSPRLLLIYLAAGALLAVNWLVFVWAVVSGYVVEASLGYFINPLVSVLLGMVFLRERLRAWQWVPVGLAAAGVLWLTLSLGVPPWIALALATSFGLYGLVKKVAPLGSLFGLMVETALIFLPALSFLLLQEDAGVGAFGHIGGLSDVLLALTGAVTVAPLLLFSAGVRLIPLSTMGLLQYISPSMQFLSGIFLFGESFTLARGVGFGLVWLALVAFSVENYLHRRRVAG